MKHRLVWFLQKLEQQLCMLLVLLQSTQGQVNSGSKSSLRTFAPSLPFCLLSCGRHHGES